MYIIALSLDMQRKSMAKEIKGLRAPLNAIVWILLNGVLVFTNTNLSTEVL